MQVYKMKKDEICFSEIDSQSWVNMEKYKELKEKKKLVQMKEQALLSLTYKV